MKSYYQVSKDHFHFYKLKKKNQNRISSIFSHYPSTSYVTALEFAVHFAVN